jgi:hypothetical protein
MRFEPAAGPFGGNVNMKVNVSPVDAGVRYRLGHSVYWPYCVRYVVCPATLRSGGTGDASAGYTALFRM